MDELFRELEESRRTEPLEQTTSSEKETLDVLPELADDDEPGTDPDVADERRLHESEGRRLSRRSTGTTTYSADFANFQILLITDCRRLKNVLTFTGLSLEQVAQLATLNLASRGGPSSAVMDRNIELE